MYGEPSVKLTFERSRLKPLAVTVFDCPICFKRYATQEEAHKCIQRGVPVVDLKPGDVVYEGRHVTGWIDGDARWVRRRWKRHRRDQEHSTDFGFDYWWIVTRVQRKGHTIFITRETGAMSGENGYRFSVVEFGLGSKPRIIKCPSLDALPEVVRKASTEWIGHTFETHGAKYFDGHLVCCRPSYAPPPVVPTEA